jgi:hypothetical protein
MFSAASGKPWAALALFCISSGLADWRIAAPTEIDGAILPQIPHLLSRLRFQFDRDSVSD